MKYTDNNPNQLKYGPDEVVHRRTDEVTAARYSVALLHTTEPIVPMSSPEKEPIAPVVNLDDYRPAEVVETSAVTPELTPIIQNQLVQTDLNLEAIRAVVAREAA